MYRKIFSCLALLMMGSMLGVQADDAGHAEGEGHLHSQRQESGGEIIQ